jgi:hypothetical protein
MEARLVSSCGCRISSQRPFGDKQGGHSSQVGVEATQNSLMTDDENVFLTLELKDDRLQSLETTERDQRRF